MVVPEMKIVFVKESDEIRRILCGPSTSFNGGTVALRSKSSHRLADFSWS